MTDREMSPFPCIVCGKKLENVFPRAEVANQPLRACTFNSPGHYGSTVFDEMDGSKLEVNICDDCLEAARKRGAVGRWPAIQKRRLEMWSGD